MSTAVAVPPPLLAGVAEAAELLGVTTARVRQFINGGDLVPVQVLRATPVFLVADVEAFAARRRPTGRPAKST